MSEREQPYQVKRRAEDANAVLVRVTVNGRRELIAPAHVARLYEGSEFEGRCTVRFVDGYTLSVDGTVETVAHQLVHGDRV